MKKLLLLACTFMLFTIAFGQSNHTGGGKKMESKMKMGKSDKMQDCVMMENGKMMVMKGGQTMPMTQDETMTNGTMVMTDGTVKMKDGKTKMLKDGQCVYMSGKMGMMKMHSKSKMEGKM